MKAIRIFLVTAVCLSVITGCAGPDPTVQKRQFEAQRNLGEAYLQEGNYTVALRELLKAESLDPNDPYLHNSLGIVYAAKGRLDQAVEHYEKALSLKPDYAPARNNLGSAYLLKQEWDAAIDCLEELTSDLVYATPHYPLYNIGWAYYNKKEYPAAEKFFQQSLDKEPDFARALWGLGLVFMATGKTDAAMAQLEKTVQKEPRFAQAFLDLGKVYHQKGKKDKAIEAFERALSLSPNNEIGNSAKKALADLN